MKIERASIVTAFSAVTIGSKVLLEHIFEGFLREAIYAHDCAKDRVAGQHFIVLPELAHQTVSAGVGPRSNNPEDYILRMYRGKVEAFLKRSKAAPVDSLAVIVYTAGAYLEDPDVLKDQAEMWRINESRCSHVIVAVLANAGPKPPAFSPYRLVHNLAGGNNEASDWTLDDIRRKAKDALDYDNHWVVVAD